MAKKGMVRPVRVTKKGGAATTEGTDYTEQTIAAGLTPNVSKNPFQAGQGVEIGISERFVFANNAPGAQAGARRQINQFFKRLRLAGIARLAPGRDGLRFNDEGAELVARLKYIDLEADKEGELVTNLKDALRTAPSVNSSGG